MSENMTATVTAGITEEQLERLLTVTEAAEIKNVPVSAFRKAIRNGTLPEGAVVKFMKHTGIDIELLKDWEPEAGTERATREDGRKKFTAMLNDEEVEQLQALGIEIIDTRAAAKKRRDARKAIAAAKGSVVDAGSVDDSDDDDDDDDGDGDTFDMFGA